MTLITKLRVNRGDTLFALRSAVALDNANSYQQQLHGCMLLIKSPTMMCLAELEKKREKKRYQQQQQTELGHAIFRRQFMMQVENQLPGLYLQSLGSLSHQKQCI